MLVNLNETNPLKYSGINPDDWDDAPYVDWTTPNLRIVRLRLLSDAGYPEWDISYCYGYVDGKPVNVSFPFGSIPKRGFKGFIIREAKRAKVFAKGMGLLDPCNYSKFS